MAGPGAREVRSPEELFSDLLAGRPVEVSDAVLDLCRSERLIPFLAAQAGQHQDPCSAYVALLRTALHREVATELARRRELRAILERFHEQAVQALVFKGTALAYQVYAQPWQRSRGDTDLWVSRDQWQTAADELVQLGYLPTETLPGDVAMGAVNFSRTDEFGLAHDIDLHWRFNNTWWLARAVNFDLLLETSVSVPPLSPFALAPALDLSLLIACLHRGAHLGYPAWQAGDFRRSEADLSLWIYDIHLLAHAIDDWERIVHTAIEHRLALLVLDGLQTSACRFGTVIPGQVLEDLAGAANQVQKQDMIGMTSDWQNFLAIPSWRLRLRWLREQSFPPRDYMTTQYGSASPVSYGRRLLRGLLKR